MRMIPIMLLKGGCQLIDSSMVPTMDYTWLVGLLGRSCLTQAHCNEPRCSSEAKSGAYEGTDVSHHVVYSTCLRVAYDSNPFAKQAVYKTARKCADLQSTICEFARSINLLKTFRKEHHA